MDYSTLTLADLKRLTVLIEERDALQARLAEITSAMKGLVPESSAPAAAPVGRPAKAAKAAKPGKVTKGGRGELKDAILKVLQSAPASGIKVETVAQEVNRSAAAIHTWFFTTGKSFKEIKKVGRGIYAWVA
jgi:hypothetical protein